MEEKMIRLLLVEDDRVDRMAFERFVMKEKLPYDYVVAGSVKEAIKLLETPEDFDLVLTDYMLGDGTAFDVLEHSKDLPSVFATGTGDEQVAVKAMKLGAYDYLIKDPEGYYLTMLPVAVEKAMTKKRNDVELKRHREHMEELVAERTAELKNEIAERSKTEERLRESEQRFRTLTSLSPAGIYQTDSNGDCIYANEAWLEMAGMSITEALGKGWIKGVHPDDRDRIGKAWYRMVSSAGTWGLEYRFMTPEGKTTWVYGLANALHDSAGNIFSYLGVNVDINERKRVEAALRKSEFELSVRDRISQIFLIRPGEEMYGAVLKVVLEIMKSKYGIFGYINEDGAWICPSLTRDVWDKCNVPEKDIVFPREQWGGMWGRAMVEKKIIISNKPLSLPEGHIPITRALDVPIIFREELIGNLLVGNKETDYGENDIELLKNIADTLSPILHSRFQIERQAKATKELETQLHQSQKMEAVGTLAGGIAHDFNNLLTTIIGNAHIALMVLSQDDPVREEIGDIRDAGERAAALTSQLLAFSRKQAAKTEIFNLNDLITVLEKMIRRLIGEHIDMIIHPGSKNPLVKADPGNTEQVIMNLIVNARDAMPNGGKLVIETADAEIKDATPFGDEKAPFEGPGVMLVVRDSGIGMDEETKQRIFEPFFTTKDRGRGTGLGLSTVYGIVQQAGGIIRVHSSPGKGTEFRIYYPKAEEEERLKAEGIAMDMDLSGSETVLIVEDDPGVGEIASRILKKNGYSVIRASGPEEALELFGQNKDATDLVLTDVIMPGMGGQELAEQIQMKKPGIKVILMSGYTEDEVPLSSVLEGENFIQKPFTPKELAGKVREVLDRES